MDVWTKCFGYLVTCLFTCLGPATHAGEFDDLTAQVVLWEDIEEISPQIKALADSGNSEAQYLWAMIHSYWNNKYEYTYQQTAFAIDPKIAMPYFQKAAESGFQPAMVQMASFYFSGSKPFSLNYYKASEWYMASMKQPPVIPQGAAIEMYSHYDDIPKIFDQLNFLDRESNSSDVKHFWKLVESAVKDSSAQAAYDLGEFFREKRIYASARFWNGIAMTGDIADAYAREGEYMSYAAFGNAGEDKTYVYFKMAADRGSAIGQKWLDYRARRDRGAAEKRKAQLAVLGAVIGLLAAVPDENLQQNAKPTCHGCIPLDLEYLWLE